MTRKTGRRGARRSLTPKQRAFVEAYLKNGQNAAAAYRTAYASKASAKDVATEASRLLNNPKIAPVIASAEARAKKATERAIEELELDGRRIGQLLGRLCTYDVRRYLKVEDGRVSFKTPDELTHDEALAVTKVKLRSDGTVEYEFANRAEALMDLARLKGEIVERKEVAGVGGPINVDDDRPKAFGRDLLEQRFREIHRRRQAEKANGSGNVH